MDYNIINRTSSPLKSSMSSSSKDMLNREFVEFNKTDQKLTPRSTKPDPLKEISVAQVTERTEPVPILAKKATRRGGMVIPSLGGTNAGDHEPKEPDNNNYD